MYLYSTSILDNLSLEPLLLTISMLLAVSAAFPIGALSSTYYQYTMQKYAHTKVHCGYYNYYTKIATINNKEVN